MRKNKKYKEVKVRCFKTGQNLYSEIFQNITEKKLEEELNKMVQAGWDRFDIERTDENKNTHINTLILNRSRLYGGSEVNSHAKSPGLRSIIKLSKCEICKHFNEEKPWTCKAFPEKIPYEIISEKIEHDAIIEG